MGTCTGYHEENPFLQTHDTPSLCEAVEGPVERDLRVHVISEMYSFNLSKSAHDFESIKYKDK